MNENDIPEAALRSIRFGEAMETIKKQIVEQLMISLRAPKGLPDATAIRIYDLYKHFISYHNREAHEDTAISELNNKRLAEHIEKSFSYGCKIEVAEYRIFFFKELGKLITKHGSRETPRAPKKAWAIASITMDYLLGCDGVARWPSNKEIMARCRFYYVNVTKSEVSKQAEEYGYLSLLTKEKTGKKAR